MTVLDKVWIFPTKGKKIKIVPYAPDKLRLNCYYNAPVSLVPVFTWNSFPENLYVLKCALAHNLENERNHTFAALKNQFKYCNSSWKWVIIC